MPRKTSDPRARIALSEIRQNALKHGYASGFEQSVHAGLLEYGIDAEFEGREILYTPPLQQRKYTPDFILPNGIIIETKGRFLTDDRQKHKNIKKEHPDLDIRFIFGTAREYKGRVTLAKGSHIVLSKASKTTYAMWCAQYGFQFADIRIPEEWINEPYCAKRWAAIQSSTRIRTTKKR